MIKKVLSLFILMGLGYISIELIYTALTSQSIRLVGYSSIWMVLVGGTVGTFLGMWNEIPIMREIFYRLHVLMGWVTCITAEYGFGLILNRNLGLGLWDYSNNFLNVNGQIDFLHSMCWLAMVPFAFWLDDCLRFLLFKEERPRPLYTYYLRLISERFA